MEILRLPIRHCSLNPVEIAWSGLKDYVRKKNTSFTMNNIYELVAEFIAGFDDKTAQGAIRHVKQVEATYKRVIIGILLSHN